MIRNRKTVLFGVSVLLLGFTIIVVASFIIRRSKATPKPNSNFTAVPRVDSDHPTPRDFHPGVDKDRTIQDSTISDDSVITTRDSANSSTDNTGNDRGSQGSSSTDSPKDRASKETDNIKQSLNQRMTNESQRPSLPLQQQLLQQQEKGQQSQQTQPQQNHQQNLQQQGIQQQSQQSQQLPETKPEDKSPTKNEENKPTPDMTSSQSNKPPNGPQFQHQNSVAISVLDSLTDDPTVPRPVLQEGQEFIRELLALKGASKMVSLLTPRQIQFIRSLTEPMFNGWFGTDRSLGYYMILPLQESLILRDKCLRPLEEIVSDDLIKCYEKAPSLGLPITLVDSIESRLRVLNKYQPWDHFYNAIFDVFNNFGCLFHVPHLRRLYGPARQVKLTIGPDPAKFDFNRLPITELVIDHADFDAYFKDILLVRIGETMSKNSSSSPQPNEESYSSLSNLSMGLIRFGLLLSSTSNSPLSSNIQNLSLSQLIQQLDLALIMQTFYSFTSQKLLEHINDSANDFFTLYSIYSMACNVRRSLTYIPSGNADAMHPNLKQMIRSNFYQSSAVTDLVSAQSPPRAVRNPGAKCYAIAIFQCLANFLPIFEQQLREYRRSPTNPLPPKTSYFFKVIRELNQPSTELYNQDGSIFPNAYESGVPAEYLQDLFADLFKEGQLSFNELHYETDLDSLKMANSPLYIIYYVLMPSSTSYPFTFPTTTLELDDSWEYNINEHNVSVPKRRVYNLKAALIIGTGHSVAQVQRANGQWYRCDDSNVTQIPGNQPNLTVTGKGSNLLLFYLRGP